jgi:protein SCO1/2
MNHEHCLYPARRRQLLLGLLGAGAALLARRTFAGEAMAGMNEHQHHHLAHGENSGMVRRREVSCTVPSLGLRREDGSAAAFPDEIEAGRPVLLNFIYTSCTTICPLVSEVFSRVQEALGAERAAVDLVSISIDPEYDTPQRLAAYARKFGAGPHWHFYTSSQATSVALQQAFEVYRGDKMSHEAVTFLHGAAPGRWVRLDGFATAEQLIGEYRGLVQPG